MDAPAAAALAVPCVQLDLARSAWIAAQVAAAPPVPAAVQQLVASRMRVREPARKLAA